MNETAQLGEFLQSRRARLSPEAVGLPDDGGPRRVPGLRREELAQVAGVSASYYGRLEQGVSLNASHGVLEALATALRLDAAEREHLHRLAEPPPGPSGSADDAREQVTEATRQLLDTVDVPAVVQGRRTDVLGWNPLGHALLAGHVAYDERARPNMARLVFCDAHTRELYTDWPRKARAIVGNLRIARGEDPADADLAALVGELSLRSETFAAYWADHEIKACDAAAYELAHPLVGPLEVTQQAFAIADAPGQTLILMTTAPGSPSRAAVQLLSRHLR